MSASLQQRQIEVGTYFTHKVTTKAKLYYVADVMEEDGYVLIEDVATNELEFWALRIFHNCRKEVIQPSARVSNS
jgi:hypothetical protein